MTATVTTPTADRPTPLPHLTVEDLDALGAELDALGQEVRATLGEDDAAYIRKVIGTQRGMEIAGRGLLMLGLLPPAWIGGTALLSVAKILENMEIGHNVMHGQWDWMRDPEIHSTNWEWDNASSSEGWRKSHNFEHHTFTNVVGKDRDLGYTLLRVDPDQPWNPIYLAQPVYNIALALGFQWGVALYDLEMENVIKGTKPWSQAKSDIGRFLRKAGKQLTKDYVVWPALSGPSAVPAFFGNLAANVTRNVWTHTIIFCGHFPDGAETFDYSEEALEGESRGAWYVRQLLGSANLTGHPLFHVMTGHLSYQIEHHLFPDIPSNRYARDLAPRVQEICERYGLPYTAGPLSQQYGQVVRRILRYALPGGASEAVPAEVLSPSSEPVPVPAPSAVADADAAPAPLAAAA